ncbi:hypothetical protein ACMA1D_21255 [Streptomyces sp. 796.1]|uniref:hypothetical protein n=1 Tax=Streptomyces sp. 796.1 TaxID=3163029 RepID=UPI0039C9A171
MHIESLRGKEVKRLLGIYYTPENEPEDATLEAVEMILTDSKSIVLYAGTDWSLRIDQGSWPSLPTWCHPPQCWAFSDIINSTAKLGSIRDVLPLRNRYSELTGAHISFDGHTSLSVTAGEQFTLEVKDDSSGGGT